MAKFNFGAAEQEAARLRDQSAQKVATNPDGTREKIRYYTWRLGENRFRFLEPVYDDGRLFFVQQVIWINKRKYECVERTWPDMNIKCPILAVLKEAYDKGMGDRIERMWPKVLAIANVIDLLDITKPAQITELRGKGYNSLMQKITRRNPPPPMGDGLYMYGDITDSQTGKPVVINMVKNGDSTEYSDPEILPTTGPLHPDAAIAEAWIKSRYPLDKIYHRPNEQKLREYVEVANGLRQWLFGVVPQVAVPAAVTSAPQPQPVAVTPDLAQVVAAAGPPVQTVSAPAPQPVAVPAQATPAPTVQPSIAAPAAVKRKATPNCYERDWRDPSPEGGAQPTPAKCGPCPWEMNCSEKVRALIAAGQTPAPVEA